MNNNELTYGNARLAVAKFSGKVLEYVQHDEDFEVAYESDDVVGMLTSVQKMDEITEDMEVLSELLKAIVLTGNMTEEETEKVRQLALSASAMARGIIKE